MSNLINHLTITLPKESTRLNLVERFNAFEDKDKVQEVTIDFKEVDRVDIHHLTALILLNKTLETINISFTNLTPTIALQLAESYFNINVKGAAH